MGFEMKKYLSQASLVVAALIAGAFAVSAAQQVPRPQLAPQTKWKLDPKLEKELAPAVREKVRRCLGRVPGRGVGFDGEAVREARPQGAL